MAQHKYVVRGVVDGELVYRTLGGITYDLWEAAKYDKKNEAEAIRVWVGVSWGNPTYSRVEDWQVVRVEMTETVD